MKLSDGKKYLKKDNVKEGDVVTFKSDGEWVESGKFKNQDGSPKKQFLIKIEWNGQGYDMALNGMNRKTMISAFSDETSEWIGKQAKIEFVKVMVSGEMKEIILLAPIVAGGVAAVDWAE